MLRSSPQGAPTLGTLTKTVKDAVGIMAGIYEEYELNEWSPVIPSDQAPEWSELIETLDLSEFIIGVPRDT